MNRKKQTSKLSKRKVVKHSHPIAAKLGILHHAHTGRVVHRHSTSYVVLIILLVVTGFFVFVGYDISKAMTLSDSLVVDMHVSAAPPAGGAVITAPKNGEQFSNPIIEVKGTCSITSEVVIYSNQKYVGETTCSTNSQFGTKIQLFEGTNDLEALNYNGVNQAGPATPTVTVKYVPDFGTYIANRINTSWLDSPVPLYLLVVAIVLGFWAGDYFERIFLAKQSTRGNRKRHA